MVSNTTSASGNADQGRRDPILVRLEICCNINGHLLSLGETSEDLAQEAHSKMGQVQVLV